MLKSALTALLACMAATPAAAATFIYTGAPFASASGTGFTRFTMQFTAPGVAAPNTTYTLAKITAYNDGLNKLPAITSYIASGQAYGGVLDAFLWGSVTTGPTGKPVSWTIKLDVFFVDGLGNEGYDMIVSGPGNTAGEPGVFDSLYTTLPETLPTIVSLSSTRYGTLSIR